MKIPNLLLKLGLSILFAPVVVALPDAGVACSSRHRAVEPARVTSSDDQDKGVRVPETRDTRFLVPGHEIRGYEILTRSLPLQNRSIFSDVATGKYTDD